MRAAGCYQVEAVFYSGKRFAQAAKFNTDTKNTIDSIPLTLVNDEALISGENGSIVCVDLVEGACPLPEFEHPDNAIYVFGPEDGTINQQIIDRAEHVVYVPTIGCMNLAATVNVVLYDRLAKQPNYIKGDGLIKTSRDRNNNTKVKALDCF